MAALNTRWKELKETYFSSVWDALMWLSLLLIVLWALAKAVGLISTPLIIEMAPIILMGFAARLLSLISKSVFEALVILGIAIAAASSYKRICEL